MPKIILKGRCPSKKNSKIISCRGSRPLLFPSKKYKEWHEDALLQLMGKVPITKSKLCLTFYAPDKRKFDLTNKAESIMDTLVDAGLIADDNISIVDELTLKFGGVEKGNARCEIDY